MNNKILINIVLAVMELTTLTGAYAVQDKIDINKNTIITADLDCEKYNDFKNKYIDFKLKQEQEQQQEQIRKANVKCNIDNILEISNITVEELIAVFEYNDYSTQMKELAHIIVEAERIYWINAFILSGIISHESSYNTSQRAIEDNSVLGWGVYSPESKGINASSKYENIMNACKFLKSDYLTPGGLYYNGYSTWSINQSYCLNELEEPNVNWSVSVNSIAKNYEKIFNLIN